MTLPGLLRVEETIDQSGERLWEGQHNLQPERGPAAVRTGLGKAGARAQEAGGHVCYTGLERNDQR